MGGAFPSVEESKAGSRAQPGLVCVAFSVTVGATRSFVLSPSGIPQSPSVPPTVNAVWVRLGIRLTLVAYGVMFAFGLVADAGNLVARGEEAAALVSTASALFLARRRPRAALVQVLATVWVLSVLALAHWGYFGGGALVVFPAVIMATGMALGGRAAVWAGAASCVALPLAYLFPGLLLRGGQRFDFATHGSMLVVSEVVFVASVLLVRAFIASYHEALERSSRANRRYGELFALAPDGLLELDETGLVRDINAAALRLLRDERAAAIGEDLPWVLRRAGAESPVDLAAVRPGAPVAFTLRPGTAEACAVEISVQQRLGSEARTLLILRDVTERRRLEERLAHTQRLETVGRLAGGVAHDFNNLLTVVGGNAGLLAEYPDPEVREMMGEIQEAHRRATALTRQLLAFARKDLRRVEVLDLGVAVRGMERLVDRLLGVQHRLALELEGAAPVRADRGQVEQVLLNLASNARDAMPDGGTVTVRCRSVARGEAAELGSSLAAERQVLLEVVDTGTGMAPEVRARLFEPFFTTKPRGQGTGLGLSMVHGIVLQNEGAVQVDSEPGRGTAVRVFLPSADGTAAGPAPVPAGESARSLGSEHILVVEDEVAVRRFAERVLVNGGYRVSNASDFDSGLAVFAAARPPVDLVLTDIVMPGRSGLELARELRARWGGVRVLFMSGHYEAAAGDPELDPATTLLTKPFSAEALLGRVAALLHGERGEG